MEDEVVNNVRSWPKLNISSTRYYVFCPRSMRGFSITNSFILYHAHYISFYIGMLSSGDTLVRNAALK